MVTVSINLLEDKVLGGQVRPHVDHDMAVLKANSKGCSHFILVFELQSASLLDGSRPFVFNELPPDELLRVLALAWRWSI